MIINEEIEVRINNKNIIHYRNLIGDVKYGDIINIFTKDLPIGSKIKVNIECDNCKSIINRYYSDYIRYKNISNEYYCRKCNYLNRRKTCMYKYGVDHYSKTKEYLEKFKTTCMYKYGVDHYSKTTEMIEISKNSKFFNSEEFIEKSNNTKFERYGDVNYNNIEKIKETKFERYGDINYNNIEKTKSTKFERYGDINYNNSDKVKETSLYRYGVDHPLKFEDVKMRRSETCLEKYGDRFPMGTEYFKNKSKETRIRKGTQIPDSELTDFDLYKREVLSITLRVKNLLINNWNGFDFYDSEFILDNFNLSSNDKNYPTIDHKISIFYGFKNNISPIDIGGISNLCITKRSINSKKNKNIYLK